MKLVRMLAGWGLGLVASVWLRTLRITVEADPALEAASTGPWVLAFFHGTMWPLLAWPRRRRTAVLVSLSADGTLLGRALSFLGMAVVRGSSSRGGARGLAALVRLVRRGEHDVAFAVDGPRGPRGVAKPGLLLAARATGAVVVPMGGAVRHGKVFRSWDRFTLAWPFSRVAIVLGAPIDAGTELTAVDESIHRANDAAGAILARGSRGVVGFSSL